MILLGVGFARRDLAGLLVEFCKFAGDGKNLGVSYSTLTTRLGLSKFRGVSGAPRERPDVGMDSSPTDELLVAALGVETAPKEAVINLLLGVRMLRC